VWRPRKHQHVDGLEGWYWPGKSWKVKASEAWEPEREHSEEEDEDKENGHVHEEGDEDDMKLAEDEQVNAEEEEEEYEDQMEVQGEKNKEQKEEPKGEDAGSWKLIDSACEGAKTGLGPKKNWWGPFESSWQTSEWEEQTNYSWKPRSHDRDNMQRDKVEGVWEDEDGSHHEIKLQAWDPPVRWSCTPRQRKNQQRIQDKAVSIDYSAIDGVCWWGVEREYFFAPSDMNKKYDHICWYSHDDWNQSWPAFTWYRVKRPFASRTEQQLKHNEPASGQKEAAAGVTKEVDATSNDSSDAGEGVEANDNTTSSAGGGFNRYVRATPLKWVPRVRPS